MHVRPAKEQDAAAMGDAHVRAWQAAYRGHMPDEYLDALLHMSSRSCGDRSVPAWAGVAVDQARDPVRVAGLLGARKGWMRWVGIAATVAALAEIGAMQAPSLWGGAS